MTDMAPDCKKFTISSKNCSPTLIFQENPSMLQKWQVILPCINQLIEKFRDMGLGHEFFKNTMVILISIQD